MRRTSNALQPHVIAKEKQYFAAASTAFEPQRIRMHPFPVPHVVSPIIKKIQQSWRHSSARCKLRRPSCGRSSLGSCEVGRECEEEVLPCRMCRLCPHSTLLSSPLRPITSHHFHSTVFVEGRLCILPARKGTFKSFKPL
jgi:hypothetical protein